MRRFPWTLTALFLLATNTPAIAATFTVTTTASSGAGSLSEAIANANATPDADTIEFNIGSGPQTIEQSSSLPPISAPLTIDGTTQPGYAGSAIVTVEAPVGPDRFRALTFLATTTVRAVILLNFDEGIGGHATDNVIEDCQIVARPDTSLPVVDLTGSGNTIRGTVITGNYDALALTLSGLSNTVQGSELRGNYGLILSNSDNQIGGTSAADRNVITGSQGNAVLIVGDDNRVEGNVISEGSFATIDVYGSNNRIGGSSESARNIIFAGAGRSDPAVRLFGSGHTVASNYINLDETGAASGYTALAITGNGHTIGGNIISGEVALHSSSSNVIEDNLIGGDPGETPTSGIVELQGPSNDNSFTGNTFLVTLQIFGGTGNLILGNSFRQPSGGIELQPYQPNDAGDGDTGPNNHQNTPVITSAIRYTSGTTITGTLSSTPSTSFTLEFFDGTACGNAAPIGTMSVSTDASGDAPFVFNAAGQATVVTATATDPSNNTSMLAACVSTVAGSGSLSIDDVGANENDGTVTFTITLSPALAEPVVVDADTRPDSASRDADYERTTQQLTFAPGETTKTVTVEILEDELDENDETLFVFLSGAPSNVTFTDNLGTATIADNDTSMIAVDNARTFEGSPARVEVTLSLPIDEEITVQYAVTGGTASAGSDFTALTGSLIFEAGEITKTIAVPTMADSLIESDETIIVTLSDPSRGVLGQDWATITLSDGKSRRRATRH